MNVVLRAFRENAGSAWAGLVERQSDDDRDRERGGDALGQLLASLYARGRAANPRIVVSEQAFGRYLARCANGLSGARPGNCDGLAKLAIEDLYLACACAEQVGGAAAVFERRFGRVIRRAVSRVLASPDERQEAEQRAWQHLLVDFSNGPPRIAQYLGQGPLESWVSVASMRVAIAFGRAESAERRLREKAVAEASGVDPEALFKKGDLRDAFEEAVKEALGKLRARERLVLKLYLVSGMTLDAIGKSLGVTRQAVAKTLARARESVVAQVEIAVQRNLKLSKEDLASLLRFVASQLEVSISRALGKP